VVHGLPSRKTGHKTILYLRESSCPEIQWAIPARDTFSRGKLKPWNLNPLMAREEMTSHQIHIAVHGHGLNPYNALGRWWYGTPDWAKNLQINIGGKAASGVGND